MSDARLPSSHYEAHERLLLERVEHAESEVTRLREINTGLEIALRSLLDKHDRVVRERDQYREGWLSRGRQINGTGEFAEAGPLVPARRPS